jgi:hypothetical protein
MKNKRERENQKVGVDELKDTAGLKQVEQFGLPHAHRGFAC